MALNPEQKKARETQKRELSRSQKKRARLKLRLEKRRSLIDLSERLMAEAPEVQARWRQERIAEDANVKKRVRSLKKRLTEEKPKEESWRRQWRRLPAPPPQPTAAEIASVVLDAPRPVKFGQLIVLPYMPPREWKPGHVLRRFSEAHTVLRRLPMSGLRPQSFTTIWPGYRNEGVELAYQASTGSLSVGRNRVIRGASSDEMALVDEAIEWPCRYLRDQPSLAREINEWASEPWHREEMPQPLYAAGIIAAGLIRDRVPIR